MKYYPVLKTDELLSNIKTWMNVKCILLTRRSQNKNVQL